MTGSNASTPGVIPLRPLVLGEIFAGAFATMRRHAALVFGASAVVAALSALLYIAADLWLLEPVQPVVIDRMASPERQADQAWASLRDMLPATGVAALINLLTQTLLTGILMIVVGRAVLGKPISFAEVWQELRPRLGALFGVTIVVTVLTTIGLAAFLLPGIWLYALLSLATPALILERGTVGSSLSRSLALVRGSWWRVFGVLVAAQVVAFVISYVIQLPFGMATPTDPAATLTAGDQILTEVGAAVARAITVPLIGAITALLYIEQRIRKENLGEELSRAAENG